MRQSTCIVCGITLRIATDPNGDHAPIPGDLSACWHCGAVTMFGDDMLLRPLTLDEARELLADDAKMAMLAEIAGARESVAAMAERRN